MYTVEFRYKMHQTEYIINTIMMITNLSQWTFIKRLFTRDSRPKKLTTKNPNKIYITF